MFISIAHLFHLIKTECETNRRLIEQHIIALIKTQTGGSSLCTKDSLTSKRNHHIISNAHLACRENNVLNEAQTPLSETVWAL